MGARIRIPLRVLLACLAVSLVAVGAVAVGLVGVSGTRGYLVQRADNGLLNCARNMLSHRLVVAPVSDPVPASCDVELLSPGGQLLTPLAPGAAAGPAIPVGGSWPAAHAGRPATVPGAGTSGSWLVLVEAVRYEPQRILYVYGPDNVRYVAGERYRDRAFIAIRHRQPWFRCRCETRGSCSDRALPQICSAIWLLR